MICPTKPNLFTFRVFAVQAIASTEQRQYRLLNNIPYLKFQNCDAGVQIFQQKVCLDLRQKRELVCYSYYCPSFRSAFLNALKMLWSRMLNTGVHVHFSKLSPFAVIKNGLLLNMFDHSSLTVQSMQYKKMANLV